MKRKLRPDVTILRGGPDGRDVYLEELKAGEARGLTLHEVGMIEENGVEIGCQIDFGAAGDVLIYGYSDEDDRD